MLGSSFKTPLSPVVETILKESVDRFTKTGRQASPLGAPGGNPVALPHLSARWHGLPVPLVHTGQLEPQAAARRS